MQLLGTDSVGRDRFSRLLIASRFSLIVGPVGTLLASALGIFLGCLAGFGGRVFDAVLMRIADAMMALPALVLILAARAAFPLKLSPAHSGLLMIAIFGLIGWAEMARLTRGLVLSLRRREFVLAAESLGLSKARILFRHILPNAMRPLLVQVTLMLPFFLLTETALSFFGAGPQSPEASWGNMLTEAGDSQSFSQPALHAACSSLRHLSLRPRRQTPERRAQDENRERHLVSVDEQAWSSAGVSSCNARINRAAHNEASI